MNSTRRDADSCEQRHEKGVRVARPLRKSSRHSSSHDTKRVHPALDGLKIRARVEDGRTYHGAELLSVVLVDAELGHLTRHRVHEVHVVRHAVHQAQPARHSTRGEVVG